MVESVVTVSQANEDATLIGSPIRYVSGLDIGLILVLLEGLPMGLRLAPPVASVHIRGIPRLIRPPVQEPC